MNRKKARWYMMAVLAYYRSEWTDVSDDDRKYRLLVDKDLEKLLLACMRSRTEVPNAAKEVATFLGLSAAHTAPPADAGSEEPEDGKNA